MPPIVVLFKGSRFDRRVIRLVQAFKFVDNQGKNEKIVRATSETC